MGGWANVKLEELCIIGDGNHSSKYPKQSDMVTDGVPFIRGTNLIDGRISGNDILYISEEKHQELKKGHLKTGDVLFTNRGEIGKVAIVDEAFDGANLNSQIAWLRCQKELLPKYLFLFLQSGQMRRHFSQEKSGAALQQFTIKMIKAVVVSYPPLPEQERIVAIVDNAFEGIDRAIVNTQKNLANARELFESYLNAIFTQKGDGWSEKKLGEISERVSVGHVGSTSEFYCEEGEGIPFLRSQNVRPGRLELDDVRYVTPQFHKKLKKSQLLLGDLLFVRVGANRGDCCSLPPGLGDLNCANIVFARPREGVLDYLEYYCRSKVGQDLLIGMTTGSAQGVINTKSVAELLIPFPPIFEQRKIAQNIQALCIETQHLEAIYRQKLAALTELKQSILQKAFTGELTTDTTNQTTKTAEEVIAA